MAGGLRTHDGAARPRDIARRLGPVIVLGIVALWTAAPVLATDVDVRRVLREGLHAFDQAVAVSRKDPQRAAELYRAAADAFEQVRAAGHANAAIEYDLGNAYYRLGDLGLAVLHYLRAQRLAPRDAMIAANLSYVRGRVEPAIESTGESKLLRRLAFWHHTLSLQERFQVAVLASVVGWFGMFVWLRGRWRPVLIASLVAIVLAVAVGGSAAWQLREDAREPVAVVVDGEHVLRLGRGEAYDPALSEPLGPGVEVRVIERRGDWVRVRLADGKTGWLPGRAVQPVVPQQFGQTRARGNPVTRSESLRRVG